MLLAGIISKKRGYHAYGQYCDGQEGAGHEIPLTYSAASALP